MKTLLLIITILISFGTEAKLETTETVISSLHQVYLPNAGSGFTPSELQCLFDKSNVTPYVNVESIVQSLYNKNGKWYCKANNNQIAQIDHYTTGPIRVTQQGRVYSFAWETSGTCS